MSNPRTATLIFIRMNSATVAYSVMHECKRKTVDLRSRHFCSQGCTAGLKFSRGPGYQHGLTERGYTSRRGGRQTYTQQQRDILFSPVLTTLPRLVPPPHPCCVIYFCIESVCTHRPFGDFKVQRWLQG